MSTDNESNRPQRPLFLRGGTVLTVDEWDTVLSADVLIRNGNIEAIAPFMPPPDDAEVVDIEGDLVIPGFVQTHVHLCQTLWRNSADELTLEDWLATRTWPLEAALDRETTAASARLGAAELIMSGTTTIADMGPVRHADAIIRAALETGIRGTFSKTLMDMHSGPQVLKEDPDSAITAAISLVNRFSDPDNGIDIALAPRFAPSCSMRLLEQVVRAQRSHGLKVMTHCSETAIENQMTVDRFGLRPVSLYDGLGLLGPDLLLVHCVHLTDEEIARLGATGTRVVTCPTTNLKLGSGIARIPALHNAKVSVSMGADGPPCNNNLSPFREMHTAVMSQSLINGPGSLTSKNALRMATIEGARALGRDSRIGSIEMGKRADIVVLQRNRPPSAPGGSPEATIVHSMDRDAVKHVLSGGRFLLRDHQLVTVDEKKIVFEARIARERLFKLAGITE